MASVQLAVLYEDLKEEEIQNVDTVGNGGYCMKIEDCDGQDNTFNIDDVGRQNMTDLAAAGDAQNDAIEYDSDSILDGTDPDSAEYCSSIEDSFSDHEDGQENDSSYARINLELDALQPIYDGWKRVFRKKKATGHWRNFIQPIIWRCKWIELKVKELQSLVARYDRELLAYGPQSSEEVKLPRNHGDEEAVGDNRQKMYQRRKRRIEDMVDVPTYLSQHVLFSYFDNRPEVDDPSFDGDLGNQDQMEDIALPFEWPDLKIKGGDKFLEQILRDIESVQLRVLNLKSRLDKIILDNGTEFYTSGTFIPGDANYRPSLSPRCSPLHNGGAAQLETGSTSQYAHGLEHDDLVLYGSGVSSSGDAGHPDIMESSVGLLSSAIDHSHGNRHIGRLGSDVADDMLISNQVVEDLNRFQNVRYPQADSLGVLVAEKEECTAAHKASSSETETDPEIAPVVAQKPTLKGCAGAAEFRLRRSKRKRKLRKTSPGSWNGKKMRRHKQPRKSGGIVGGHDISGNKSRAV